MYYYCGRSYRSGTNPPPKMYWRSWNGVLSGRSAEGSTFSTDHRSLRRDRYFFRQLDSWFVFSSSMRHCRMESVQSAWTSACFLGWICVTVYGSCTTYHNRQGVHLYDLPGRRVLFDFRKDARHALGTQQTLPAGKSRRKIARPKRPKRPRQRPRSISYCTRPSQNPHTGRSYRDAGVLLTFKAALCCRSGTMYSSGVPTLRPSV